MKETITPDELLRLFGIQGYPPVSFACGGWRPDHRCVSGFVYVARGDSGMVKIGYTGKIKWIGVRLEQSRHQYGMGFTLLFALQTHCARQMERRIHSIVKDRRVSVESGRELFALMDYELLHLSRIVTFAEHPVTLLPALNLL